MRKEKVILLSIVLIGVFILAGTYVNQKSNNIPNNKETIVITSNNSWPYYTFESAIDTAVTIVHGRAVGKSDTKAHQITFDEQPSYEYYKEVSIEVIDILKGDMDATTVTYLEFGGETEDAIYIYEGKEQLKLGSEYVLFLNQYGAALSPKTLLVVEDDVVLTQGKLVPESDVSTLSIEISVESYLNAIKSVLSE